MARKTGINPRKTPRQPRSEATVNAIVEAATHILAEEGLGAFNTNAVADRAGVSIGSLYQYYPGKDAILTDLLRRKRAGLLQDFTAVLKAVDNMPERQAILALVTAAIRHQARAPKLALALDYANAVLPLHEETAQTDRAIAEGLAGFLDARHVPYTVQTARDIAALTRGMMNDAFQQKTVCETALAGRITLAIRGYIGELRRSAEAPA